MISKERQMEFNNFFSRTRATYDQKWKKYTFFTRKLNNASRTKLHIKKNEKNAKMKSPSALQCQKKKKNCKNQENQNENHKKNLVTSTIMNTNYLQENFDQPMKNDDE